MKPPGPLRPAARLDLSAAVGITVDEEPSCFSAAVSPPEGPEKI